FTTLFLSKHLADPVPVASDVDAKIPRWLSNVIVKCLAKKPEDRFQSAEGVLAAIDAGRASGSTRLVGAQTLERQVRRSGEMRRASGALGWWVAGAVTVLLVGGWAARRAGYVGSSVAFLHNALIEPVEVLRGGVPVDTVAPEGTVRLWVGRAPAGGGELAWRLIRPGNPPIGEPLEGPVSEFRRVRGRRVATVTAEAGGQPYFAPLVTGLVVRPHLGVATEGKDDQAIRAACPQGVRDLAPPPKGSPFDDDAAMTLLLADSLAEKGDFDAEDVAQRWVKWMNTDGRGIGFTTQRALRLIEGGTKPFEAGRLAMGPRSASNGAVMRCLPVALRYHDHLDKPVRATAH